MKALVVVHRHWDLEWDHKEIISFINFAYKSNSVQLQDLVVDYLLFNTDITNGLDFREDFPPKLYMDMVVRLGEYYEKVPHRLRGSIEEVRYTISEE
jgi:hypothetical protein